MSAVGTEVAVDPVVVEERIRPIAIETARNLWEVMGRMEARDRFGRSQFYGLVEIAQNQPGLLEGFISHQTLRTKSLRQGVAETHRQCWGLLRDLLRRGGTLWSVLDEIAERHAGAELSKKQRTNLVDQFYSAYAPVCVLLTVIEYLYLSTKGGAQ